MKNETKGKYEMTFDYRTLKQAAREGSRLGNWNGKAVFAAGTAQLDNLGSGAYYILYDDENKIVAKTSNGWKSYGEVSESGSVNEYSSARRYSTPAESVEAANAARRPYPTMSASGKNKAESVASVASYTPGYDRTERPTGDVKMGLDVEGTLKKARELSIDDLLAGFLPNVDFDSVAAKG